MLVLGYEKAERVGTLLANNGIFKGYAYCLLKIVLLHFKHYFISVEKKFIAKSCFYKMSLSKKYYTLLSFLEVFSKIMCTIFSYLLRKLEDTVLRDLDLMHVLLWKVDEELEKVVRAVELGSLFALSWPLTWFSHSLHNHHQVCFVILEEHFCSLLTSFSDFLKHFNEERKPRATKCW